MKYVPCLLSLVVLLLFCFNAEAQSKHDHDAQAAIAISLATQPVASDPARHCNCAQGDLCLCELEGKRCTCVGGRPPKPIPAPVELTYDEACALSLKTSKPIIAFVGCRVLHGLKGLGILASSPAKTFSRSGYPDYCIVIGVPKDGVVTWKATLSPDASEENVRYAVERREASIIPIAPTAPVYQAFQQPAMRMLFGGGGGGGGGSRGGSC